MKDESDSLLDEHVKIHRQLLLIPQPWKDLCIKWNQSMRNGDTCYGRPIGYNCRRIYLSAARKYLKSLKSDFSNLYESVIAAIEECKPEQYSTKKHIKEAAISFSKFLLHKGRLYGHL